jgi:hypothetical protein
VKSLKFTLALSAFICVYQCCICFAVEAQAKPLASASLDEKLSTSAAQLESAKLETQKLKDAWDKVRLETTLYDQRAKRAYQHWVKAAKKTKEQAKAAKDRADLEFQLAVEKRKLAYCEWQTALLRQAAKESEVLAMDQQKDMVTIRGKIKQLEGKLNPPKAADSR